jgi:hypothetical protein
MSNPHISMAEEWLVAASNVRSADATHQLMSAQAEALIAIAKELRAANLLTLARHPETDPESAGSAYGEAEHHLKR